MNVFSNRLDRAKEKKCELKDMSKKIKDNETRRMKFLKRMRYEKYCERI